MRRLPTFIFGMLAGGVLIYLALNYHLIQAQDGLHLVPKVNATLSDTYVDLRTFKPSDFIERKDVVAALLKSGQTDLIESTASTSLDNGLNQFFRPQK